MNTRITQFLQWARRVRDFLAEHPIKSEVAELTALRLELDALVTQITANAAAQDALTKQSQVQTREIRRLRKLLRDGHLKPIVGMSRTMTLQNNGANITFELPRFKLDNERLAASGDAMVTALKEHGPEFVARGFAPNFAEQLKNATTALRAAVDLRSAQFARRTGVTAAMERDATRLAQLVRVIDALVRPAVNTVPELRATWESVVHLPRRAIAASATATSGPTQLVVIGGAEHGQEQHGAA